MAQHHQQQQLRMPVRNERTEDEFITNYRLMLSVMHKLHDLGGDPNIKSIIDSATAALGRVPH